MAAPSSSLRSKQALDRLISRYMQNDQGGGMGTEHFEAAYFREVVGSSLSSSADLVTISSFEQLLRWASSSLDILRPELLAFCYYLFLKSYIRLVQKAKHQDAICFWLEFNQHFAAEYGEEMREVAQLTSVEQLDPMSSFLGQHPHIKCMVEDKVSIRMSSTSFLALKNFIVDCSLHSVLAVLNAEFNIDVCGTLCQDLSGGVACGTLLRGHTQNNDDNDDIESSNRDSEELDPSKWIVPGVFPVNSCGNKRGRVAFQNDNIFRQEVPSPIVKGTDDNSFFSSVVDQAVLPRVLTQESCGSIMTRSTSLDSSSASFDSQTSDVENLPSVLFGTFVNTYEEMTCLHVTQDTKLAAAGFSGGMDVMVWNWENTPMPQTPFCSVLPCGKTTRNIISEEEFRNSSEPLTSDFRQTKVNSYYKRRECGPSRTLKGHSQRVYSVSIDEYSGENRFVISSAADKTVRLWDLRRKACSCCVGCYPSFDGITWSVEFGPFGHHFLVGNQGGTAVLYGTDDLRALRVFRHCSDVICSSFHPNAAFVATGTDDGVVRIWDIRDGSQRSLRYLSLSIKGIHAGGVTALQCSPCGTMLAAGHEDGTTAVWDIPSGMPVSILSDETDREQRKIASRSVLRESVHALQFNPSASKLATGGQDCAVKIWDLSSSCCVFGNKTTYSLTSPIATYHTKLSRIYALSGFKGGVLFAGGPTSLSVA